MSEPPERVETLTAPQAAVQLGRAAAGRAPVRAWDAADELVLAHLDARDLIPEPTGRGRIAIVNDSFGALGTVLASASPLVFGDAVTAEAALAANLARNELAPDAATFVPTGTESDLDAELGLVVIKVPKTVALLEAQLAALAPHMTSETVVVGAAMARNLHRSALAVFERLLGPTTTSLATKKARLVHPAIDANSLAETSTAATGATPASFVHDGLTVFELPGVFSAGRIDPGTELLLGHLRSETGFETAQRIVDLGCGNGIVGTVMGALAPEAHVVMSDVSWSAVASARLTWQGAFSDRDVTCVAADCLPTSVAVDSSVDVVVTNPPFHADHAVGDAISWRMFNEVHRALVPGGRLIVVGNRHLAYHAKLKRIFGNSQVVASNPKFVVSQAQKREGVT